MDAYRDQYATLFNGGKGVKLLAISADSAGELAAWAHDRNYPFQFLSDTGSVVGRLYGAWVPKYHLDNRTLFIVRNGHIARVMAPFREIDPTAYTELKAALDSVGR
jgi:peroxiredoxin